jgi:MraZ protein
MFIGRYQHTIDPKGRVSIPARYRTVLSQSEGTLIVVPQDQCLNVYPFAAWERVVGALNDQSQFDERLRRVGRLWISRAREVELDGAGRILLPPDSRQQAGLAKDVTLVGLGRDFFEIWDRRRFEEYERAHGDELASDFNWLSQVGVK